MTNNQSNFLFHNINIIGLGLLGGSLAKACKNEQLSHFICGFDKDQSTINFAITNNIIDKPFSFKSESAQDLTIIAAPLLSYKNIFQKLSLKNNGIIIDIGSLKSCVIDWAENILPNNAANFIACHPIAGSDKSGITNSNGDLFLNKRNIITHSKFNNQEDLRKVELFWQRVGSNVNYIDAKEHDKIFALVSHLPQFLAFIAQENYVNGGDENLNRHFRLQNSNPKIWQEIFLLNRKNIEYYLQFYLQNIEVAINHPKSISNREILVDCFINLPDILQFKGFAGSGFRDFTAIRNSKSNLPKNNQKKFLNQIQSKIINYDFK